MENSGKWCWGRIEKTKWPEGVTNEGVLEYIEDPFKPCPD
jgi:hypothetical protein